MFGPCFVMKYLLSFLVLLIVTPIVGVCNCSMFCCMLLYVHSSFAIILMGKRELAALLSLSSWCHVIVVWLFLAVPWVCLQFVIVVISDHPHYFCNHLAGVERELVALLYLCSCCHVTVKCSMSLPRSAVGWSVVCYCAISLSYSR